MTVALTAVVALAGAVAGIRWLRVAQREHYLPGTVGRFSLRWWLGSGPANVVLFVAGVVAALAALFLPVLSLLAGAVALVAPLGLGLRGRTSPLVWTRRLTVLAIVSGAVVVLVVALALLVGPGPAVAGLLALRMDAAVDVALVLTRPLEVRAAARYVRQARERLDQFGPTTVAITGSYGKTTVKGQVRHLVEGHRSVLASPASFNNAAGLSRTVNERLLPGTEVFVAEMGTYGAGEIADLCSWVRPSVAVICAIGPVHLERMKTLDAIVAAKSEILPGADVAVLNVDAYGLADVADRAAADGQRVIRVSTGGHAEADVITTTVSPGKLVVTVDGVPLTCVVTDAAASNVACAVATAVALGVPLDHIAARLPSLPAVEHRRQVSTAPSGVIVVDDTYNANPAGTAAALDTLHGLPATRTVVVTPGMVELGPIQARENRVFGQAAGRVADDVIVVGRTNRAPLTEGLAGTEARVQLVATRDDAVAWVRANLGPGDAVLYENDLPDHYP